MRNESFSHQSRREVLPDRSNVRGQGRQLRQLGQLLQRGCVHQEQLPQDLRPVQGGPGSEGNPGSEGHTGSPVPQLVGDDDGGRLPGAFFCCCCDLAADLGLGLLLFEISGDWLRTRAVAAGDFDTRLPTPSRDEIGFLISSGMVR